LYEQRVTTFSIVVRVGDSFVVALYLRQKSNYSSCALAVRGVWCAWWRAWFHVSLLRW